jgi:hypothetical protein
MTVVLPTPPSIVTHEASHATALCVAADGAEARADRLDRAGCGGAGPHRPGDGARPRQAQPGARCDPARRRCLSASTAGRSGRSIRTASLEGHGARARRHATLPSLRARPPRLAAHRVEGHAAGEAASSGACHRDRRRTRGRRGAGSRKLDDVIEPRRQHGAPDPRRSPPPHRENKEVPELTPAGAASALTDENQSRLLHHVVGVDSAAVNKASQCAALSFRSRALLVPRASMTNLGRIMLRCSFTDAAACSFVLDHSRHSPRRKRCLASPVCRGRQTAADKTEANTECGEMPWSY